MATTGERSPHELATLVRDRLCAGGGGRLYLVPSNRFDLRGESAWWVSPTSVVPAYSRAKLLFSRRASADGATGETHCGLHVEKGFEAEAEDPAQRLRPDWDWHAWLAALADGAVAASVRAAVEASGSPLRLRIVATAEHAADDGDEFRAAADASGALADVVVEAAPKSPVATLRNCASLADVGATLTRHAAAFGWYWIDVFLTAPVGEDVDRAAAVADAFEPWLRRADQGDSSPRRA